MSREYRNSATSDSAPVKPRMRIVVMTIMAIVLGFVVGSLWGPTIAARSKQIVQWAFNMSGESATTRPDSGDSTSPADYYTCGMHPWVILPEPGLCPICHMDLTPLDASKLRGEISIDPIIVQNIGVRIAPVESGVLRQHIRTVGAVEYNERAVRDVNTKIAGWIETLHVDAVGESVDVGQPLFDLYSPELYQAQEEYLIAWRARESSAPTSGFDLLDSARTKLEYLDVSDEQIQRLEERGVPQKTLTIRSPHKGIVTEKHATEGMRIEPGMRVYQIADLSTVWVMTTVYEHQLPLVRVGQEARMTLPFLPGNVFEGHVAYVYPYLNESARQARVRIEFDNEDQLLKPGMFATVELNADATQESVLAPREAVLTTGERQVAFISLGEGRFEPREIKTGLAADGKIQILEGLQPGEMVVTSGQFLLDSESRMREALAKMITGEQASEQRSDAPVVETGSSPMLSPQDRSNLTAMLRA